jgi:hypothetical protein
MCAHHDVGKFQIAVYDATCVRVAHGVAHLLEDGDEAAQSLGRPLPLLEQLAQRVALDELHGQKRLAVGERANFVGGRDARVLQLAGDGGLDAEAHGGRRIGRHLGLERLDSHVSVEERVACAADHAHAARAPICSASSWRPASSSLWAAEERGFEHWLGCGAASSDIMARASRSRTVCIVLRDWAGNARPLCLVPRLRPAKAWRARAAGATPAPRFAKGGLVFAVCTGAWLSPRLQRGLGFASLALGRINVV